MPARPKRITLTPTASDVNGITTTNNPAGAATMLINGVLATLASDPDGVQTAFTPAAAGNIALGDQIGAVGIVFTNPTYLSFLTASDESGKVITVNGKGPDGSMIGEQITGPNATTGYSTLGNAVFATPQHVTLTASTDESGGTWIVYGLDRYQNVVSESITGPNATTITTTGNFAVVTRVDVDAAATNVTVGVDGTCESGWLTLDTYSRDFEVSMGINLGGTATYSVQHTFDDVYSSTFDEDAANQLTHASLVGQTADADGTYISPVAAVRLALTAHTSGNAVFTVLQAG
jgi:hypothetical protein